ncbi:MAG: hypothetical protein IKA02_01320 [Clostridia bacterium]|nr:hypothetical protein [Clostridia bacterium]
MGFGLLFIGYFFTFIGALALPISQYTYVIGTGIILYSLKKLILENKMFVASAIFACLFEIFSIVVLFLNLFQPQNGSNSLFSSIQMVLSIVLNALLLLSIFIISKEVGATKIQSKSIVNLVVTAIAFVLITLSIILPDTNAQARCFLVGYIAMIVYTVFTLICIFNCYASICYEGDENMEKETGNKPLDFLNKILNKAMNKNKNNHFKDKSGKK